MADTHSVNLLREFICILSRTSGVDDEVRRLAVRVLETRSNCFSSRDETTQGTPGQLIPVAGVVLYAHVQGISLVTITGDGRILGYAVLLIARVDAPKIADVL